MEKINFDLDLSTRCRACLTEDPEMHFLYGPFDQGLTLADILTSNSSFEIIENDGLPPYLCENCTTVVVDFYNFKSVFKQNESYIKSLLDNIDRSGRNDELEVREAEDVSSENFKTFYLENSEETEKAIEDRNEDGDKYDPPKTKSVAEHVEENDSGQFSVSNELVEIKEKYTCSICGEHFLSEVIFEKHMTKQHKLKADYEKHCTKTFVKYPIVKIEEVNVEEAKVKICKICSAMFDTNEELKEHLNVHKKFICEQCGATFLRKSYLNDHSQVHLNVKTHICSFCNKAFKRRTCLVKHRRIHTNPRESVCEVCGQRFNYIGNLKTHIMLKHVGSRNFQCPLCGLSFPLKSTLQKHIRRHDTEREKVHVCGICNMSYQEKSSLKRHMVIKHSTNAERPSCEVCGKEYTTNTNLLKHVRKHHPFIKTISIKVEEKF